jgi:hypothetical protein
LFGQAAFLEASVPLGGGVGIARLLNLGISAGYVRSSLTSDVFPDDKDIHFDLQQVPVFGFVRAHVPTRLPVSFSVCGFGGVTRAWLDIAEDRTSVRSSGAATGLVLGAGADVAFPLRPGEVVFGLRYMAMKAARFSNGDKLTGDLGGILVDFGFRLGR